MYKLENDAKETCVFNVKKVTLVKLVEIEICCSLNGVDQKFPWTKGLKIESKRYDLK